jgi:hypothetical protein
MDRAMQASLEGRGLINWWAVINWCAPVRAGPKAEMARLYALDTDADGNCLLHALSLGLAGFHDRMLTLRASLHLTVPSLFCVV